MYSSTLSSTSTLDESGFLAMPLLCGLRHIVTSFVAPLLSPHVSTLSHKRLVIGKKKKVTEHKICFDFLYNFCLKYFSR